MPEVRPAVELLDGYGDVIDACRNSGAGRRPILEQHLPAADQFDR